MGVAQTSQNTDFLFSNYEMLSCENELKILVDKTTKTQLILKQQSFVSKSEYDRHLKQIKEKQPRYSPNILRMIKLWSKEHNGVCSNVFKIYSLYEYPKIRLTQEIQARKEVNKWFEEGQLISILQSCLDAFTSEPLYLNISPHLIFILEEGLLKLHNVDLMDPNYHTVYNKDYYYSPEKMMSFQEINLTQEERQKQRIFSLGMTILHAALLSSPSECYQISKKRFNKKRLDHLKAKLLSIYSQTISNLISSMLEIDINIRINLHQLQSIITELSSYPSSVNSFTEHFSNPLNTQTIEPSQLMQIGKDIGKSPQKQTESNMNGSQATLKSFVNPVRKSQFQIIIDSLQRNSIKKQGRMSESMQDKENSVFTDVHLMKIIKQGIQRIENNNKSRQILREKNDMNNYSNIQMQSSTKLQNHISRSDHCHIVQEYEDGSRYQGTVKKGIKDGLGKLIYPDGVYYQGTFKNDTLSGKGSLYYAQNRPAYVGQWKNNKFNGFGTLYNQYSTLIESPFDFGDFTQIKDYWVKFQGYFKDDLKEGMGKIMLTNGQTMQGMFKWGVINGQGVFTDLTGRKIRGVWQNNKLKNLVQ